MSLVPTIIHPSSPVADPSKKGASLFTGQDTVEISPHDAEVLGVEFSATGRSFLTASVDKTIKIFPVYSQQHDCIVTLKGHKNAVLEAHWSSDCDRIYSCSADETCGLWDPTQCACIMRLRGHEGIVNCCTVDYTAPNLLVSGGDDRTTKVWDLRVRRAVISFPNKYQILSVAFDGVAHRVFSASLDSYIRCYDIRKIAVSPSLFPSPSPSHVPPPSPSHVSPPSPSHVPLPLSSLMEDETNGNHSSSSSSDALFTLTGHSHSVTGIALSSSRSYLVSSCADQTVRIWDARPFCKDGDRRREVLCCRGPTHNFEQTLHRVRWSPDDLSISSGSADRNCYIISVEGLESAAQAPQILYKLPGHIGAVTEVAFHPTDRIIASSGTDKRVILRRLK